MSLAYRLCPALLRQTEGLCECRSSAQSLQFVCCGRRFLTADRPFAPKAGLVGGVESEEEDDRADEPDELVWSCYAHVEGCCYAGTV